jgi:diguanylate cyclase (GGDEF)-like protein/hemerythrin-like metal-binding protein
MTPRDHLLGVKVLVLVVGLYVVTIAGLVVGSAHLTRERLISDRIIKLQAVVEITDTMAKLLEADVVADRLTKSQAIDRFRTLLYATRYNGTDYLFAYDFDGSVIALGNDPKVQGQNRFGLRDVNGKLLIQEMLAAARSGGGTVDYWYPRKPGAPPAAKLAYVQPFVPWNMFIGTGVYIDDIDAAFGAYVFDVAVVLLGALGMAGGLAIWITRAVTASISERRVAQAKIIHLAHHDTLTDLPNRALLQDRLSQAVRQANRDPSSGVALFLCDLDHFKEVNDTFGHQAGDVVLQVTAQRFLGCIRAPDTVARLGGDEFCIVLPRITDTRAAEAIAARLVAATRQPISINGQDVSVGLSMGIALLPTHGSTGDALIAAADAALYEAKRGGRNGFAFASVLSPLPIVSLPLIAWTTAHDVGIALMDKQHRRLVEHLNDLATSLKRGDDSATISDKLKATLAYTQHHFESEERLMERVKFADAADHREKHSHLLDDLRSFSVGCDARSLSLTTKFLQEWLLRHVDSADRELAKLLMANGVR